MCRAQRALPVVRLNFACPKGTPVVRLNFACPEGTSTCSPQLRSARLAHALPSNKKMRSAACKGCASRAQRALLLVRLSFVNSLAAPSRHKKNAKCGAMHRASRAQRALPVVRLNFALLVWLTPSRQTKKCEVQPAKAVLRSKNLWKGVRGRTFPERFSPPLSTNPPHTLRISPFRRRSGDRTVRGLCPVPGRHRG